MPREAGNTGQVWEEQAVSLTVQTLSGMQTLKKHLALELELSAVGLKSAGTDNTFEEKIKLTTLGGSLYPGCTFETFKPLVLVAEGGKSRDQGKGERSYPQD